MIRNSFFLLLLFCLFRTTVSLSQVSQKKEKEIAAVSLGTGVLTFHGDVGQHALVGDYSFIRSGYSFSIEKFFKKNFSVSASLLKGKIARDEKASDNLPKLNFESPITQLGINGTLLLVLKPEQLTIPYVALGLSYLSFDPHGDLLDRNGNNYYYWKDGSIRDLPETGMNYFYAQTINRDYVYETKLSAGSNYAHHTFTLPLAVGIKLKLTSRFDANIGLSYHLAFSDYLDNVKSGTNDKFLYSSASLTWHLFKLPKAEQEKISNVDYAAIDRSDTDKDGIPDNLDGCPNNPVGVKVDAKGCPIDSDADGVPDYLDKEPHSKGGLPVDVNGVELTKAKLAEMQKASKAAIASRRDALSSTEFNKKPSADFMKEVEAMQLEMRKNPDAKTAATNIPSELKIADWNKDGFISADEIAKTIDAFFDGTINFSAEQIHSLINFFFDQ